MEHGTPRMEVSYGTSHGLLTNLLCCMGLRPPGLIMCNPPKESCPGDPGDHRPSCIHSYSLGLLGFFVL